jgi:ribosome-associated protein
MSHEPLTITNRVQVPASAMVVHAVRSGGPGGQNVNKVATKVELVVDLAAIEGLSEAQRARLTSSVRGRLDKEGHLHITSQKTRSQRANLYDAQEKLRAMIEAALPSPKRRVATRPSRRAEERRLDAKRRDGQRKESRRAPRDD